MHLDYIYILTKHFLHFAIRHSMTISYNTKIKSRSVMCVCASAECKYYASNIQKLFSFLNSPRGRIKSSPYCCPPEVTQPPMRSTTWNVPSQTKLLKIPQGFPTHLAEFVAAESNPQLLYIVRQNSKV